MQKIISICVLEAGQAKIDAAIKEKRSDRNGSMFLFTTYARNNIQKGC